MYNQLWLFYRLIEITQKDKHESEPIDYSNGGLNMRERIASFPFKPAGLQKPHWEECTMKAV